MIFHAHDRGSALGCVLVVACILALVAVLLVAPWLVQ